MKTTLIRFALGLLLGSACVHAAEFVVVAHPSIPANKISSDDLKAILLGTKTRLDGAPLRLVVLSDGPVHTHVVSTLTSKSADQFEKYWKKQVFTGKGVMPDQFKNDADLVAFVAKTPGAIGYVAPGADVVGTKIVSLE